MAIGLGAALMAIGAGIAVGFSAIGAGIGVGITGASSAGVTSERPEKFGAALIFSAIPQTQAIYGLLVAVLILLSAGFFGGLSGDVPVSAGLAGIGAGLAAGIAGLSSIGQGIAASSGIAVTANKPEMFGKSVVFSVICETQAIYGLLIAVLLLVFSGLLSGNFIVSAAVGLAAVGCGLAIGLSGISAIGQGIAAASGITATAENPDMFGRGVVFAAICETQAIYGLLVAILVMSFTGMFTGSLISTLAAGVVAIGCGFAVGFAGFSAIGQGIAASAGIGATSENSDMFGRGIVFSAICETQAIYGLLVAILLMAFTGIITHDFITTVAVGVAAVGAGIAVGLGGFSAIGQGITSAAGIAATARHPETMGRSLVFAAMSETFAIFGLLVAILILFGLGIFTI